MDDFIGLPEMQGPDDILGASCRGMPAFDDDVNRDV